LDVVRDIPGRGRGVFVTRTFRTAEVICDYGGKLLGNKEGKAIYDSSSTDAMGYMFHFPHAGKKYWRDATEEVPGYGRVINHSKCHANV
jgi:hypothetical protein